METRIMKKRVDAISVAAAVATLVIEYRVPPRQIQGRVLLSKGIIDRQFHVVGIFYMQALALLS